MLWLTIQLLVVAGPMQLHAANPALTPDTATSVRLNTNGTWPRAGVSCNVLPPGIALHAGGLAAAAGLAVVVDALAAAV